MARGWQTEDVCSRAIAVQQLQVQIEQNHVVLIDQGNGWFVIRKVHP